MSVRVRFAPAPTGYLHIGLARTALFNYLFAKKYNGKFILRIEDTDELRSSKDSVLGILEGLTFLGLNWDEGPVLCENFEENQIGSYGPYFQMQRLHIYKKYAEYLLENDYAYYCYCKEEELEEMRKRSLLLKQPPRYDGRCRNLANEKKREFETQMRKKAIRFKMPKEGVVSFQDLIRGKIEFSNESLDDFIIMKSNGVPTYNFACVVDDHLMEITHVIRGDDHISNTPKQIHIYNAFNWTIPKFAHLPMILGPDGSKLSKRHGAMDVLEYKKMGFLPQAMVNYLALLGWSTEDSQQVFEPDELIEKFSLERCGESPCIFDVKKMTWMNSEYIKKLSQDELYRYSRSFIGEVEHSEDYIKKALFLEREKMKLLSDAQRLIDFFIKKPSYETSAIEKYIKDELHKNILADIKKLFLNEMDFNAKNIENELREYAKKNNYKTSDVFHPIRVAVSGRMEGPSLFEMLELLGKERVIKRIEYVLQNF